MLPWDTAESQYKWVNPGPHTHTLALDIKAKVHSVCYIDLLKAAVFSVHLLVDHLNRPIFCRYQLCARFWIPFSTSLVTDCHVPFPFHVEWVIWLLFHPQHRESIEKTSRLFSVEAFTVFLSFLRMWFMALNPLSHSAGDKGSTLHRFSLALSPWHAVP